MTDTFSTPDDLGDIRQSELHASLGERLGAQAADALDPKNSPSGMWLFRRAREADAGGQDQAVGAGGDLDVFSGSSLEDRQAVLDQQRAAIPDTPIGDAKARVKQEGLEHHLNLPDQPTIKSPVLDLMIAEAHERRDREMAVARGPEGFIPGALGLVTSIGAGMIDPVNMAAFSLPVIGEARMGKIMASAGDSILNRTGARALQGAAQGAAGTALLQPADWWLHTQDGQDYTFADALKSVVMGAGMGAGFHAAGGLIGDVRARYRGAPLPGSPEDLVARSLQVEAEPAPAADEPTAKAADSVEAFTQSQTVFASPAHPADVVADLPPAAREDLARGAIADIAADRPVRGAEMLQIAADHDPRIAESLNASQGRLHALSSEARSWPEPPEGASIVSHGDHGPELEGLEGRWGEAVDWLRTAQSGDARGVLEHPEVPGRIDVIWGNKQFGLEHIVDKHPEVLPDLPERLARMAVVRRGNHRILLESPDGQELALVRTDFGGEAKTWLLTAYEREGGRGGGTPESPTDGGPAHSPVPPEGKITPDSASSNPQTDPDLVTKPKPLGRATAHPDTLSLGEHLASQGGLKPDPELKAIYGGDRGPFLPGFGPLIRKSGMSLDDALSSAKQHGYMFDPHDIPDNGSAGTGGPGGAGRTSHGLTPNDLLDHLDAENRGARLYKPTHAEATKYDPEQEKHVILGALETELEKSGADVSAIDPKLLNRTVEIVHREGESDVMVAYERAIMEDTERYDALADARQSDATTRDLPGWDVPADAGPASGDGRQDPADRGTAGGAEQGPRGGNGAQPSGDRRGDLTAAAADPRWRELADVRPEEFDPDVVAESRAADRLPEPDSLVPEKSLTALEKQAADAEAIWRQMEPTLSEHERTLVNDVLDQLKLDKEARDKIITDGAACLVGAIA